MARIYTYADSVKANIEHALVEPTKLGDICNFSKAVHTINTIELEVIAGITNMDKHTNSIQNFWLNIKYFPLATHEAT